jgi:hypothetical protein
MGEFTVELGLLDLVSRPMRIRRLRLDELEIQIPPRRDAAEKRSNPESEPPPAFVVEDLVADGAVLRILRREPEDPPLEFRLYELRVLSAGIREPMRFEALLENATPPGKIRTKGSFGPLVLHEPGESAVSGEYVFADADLSVFGGIRGVLHAEGRFEGVLERIEVNGVTETPDFQLSSVGNPVRLATQFRAVVDGTNGNTFLTPVNAVLESSRFETEGGVSRVQSYEEGKTVCVDARGERGRIEDFLRLAMKSERPFMTGEVRFQSMVLIPPGDVDVVEKLVLDGEFAIESAHFPEPAVQKKVEDLSQAGSGAKSGEDALASLREERVLSDVRGAFELSKGVLELSALRFTVPGAAVTLRGTYELKTQRIDLHGELRMDAELSEATTGLKSFFLKLVDPLFERKGTGAVVPIRIAGSAEKPSFGVDLGRVVTRKEVTSPAPNAGERGRSIRSCRDVFGRTKTGARIDYRIQDSRSAARSIGFPFR